MQVYASSPVCFPFSSPLSLHHVNAVIRLRGERSKRMRHMYYDVIALG